MILVETSSIEDFVRSTDLACEDPLLRAVERNMRDCILHAEELADDIVIEPYFRIGWDLLISDFGVPLEQLTTTMPKDERSLAYSFNFPISKPEEIAKLKSRSIAVDRQKTLHLQSLLSDAIGEILPVKVANYDNFATESGRQLWVGQFYFGLTNQLFRLIGNNGLLFWVYDQPDAIHKLMSYILQDRIALFDFLEQESLLAANSDNQFAGPGSYGYVSEMPGPKSASKTILRNEWGWAESQESAMISPAMFAEFFLPYLAQLSSRFGLVYYGCCEPLDDRLDLIIESIPNLRSVSVSAWADFRKIAEIVGRNFVFSRKAMPAYLSGANPIWDLIEKDIKKTYAAARECNIEIILRDLYTINADISRLKKWVSMTKSVFEI